MPSPSCASTIYAAESCPAVVSQVSFCARVAAHRAATRLQEAALDRETGIVEIEERCDLPHALAVEQFRVVGCGNHDDMAGQAVNLKQ